MSDHFDITLERKLESSGEGAGRGVTGVRRIELITGAERRRRWSEDDKVRIVVESFAPGANVSEVARRNGLSPQQLFAWRRETRELLGDVQDADVAAPAAARPTPKKAGRARLPAPSDDAPAFVPLVIAAAAPASPAPPASPGTIEIAIGDDAVVRIVGQVEAALLTTVLRAVRRAT